jgi:hypothetical protein
MATYVPAKKNTEFIFYASVVSQANTKVMQGNPTIAAGDFKVSTDGGALGNLTTIPAVTPAGSAMIKFTLSATEMNGDNITVVGIDAAGSEWCDLVVNIHTAANQIDDIKTDTAAILVDTADMQPKLGTPSADISADIAAVKSDTGNILTDTGTTLDNHLTDIKGTGFAKDTHSLTNIEGYADLIDDGTSGLVKIASDVAAILVDTAEIGAAGVGLTDITGRLPSALTKGTADSGTTTTAVDAARTEADTDYWKGSWIRFTSGTISGQTRLISGFTPASDTITFTPATTQAVGTNTYEIIPAGDIDTVSTLTGHTAQTGDNYARLGAPAGASVSADIAAVKVDTAAILVDTADIQPNYATAAELAKVPKSDGTSSWNATALAAINAECDTALTDYGANTTTPPTAASIADAVWDETLTAHATADSGAVYVKDILTDTAEIGAAGAGLTNINLPDQTMNITGDITGNLSGSVGSVTGAVGSVTGAVGSVTGAVGSVTAGVTVAVGGIVSGALAAAELNNIADAVLDRNMATGTDSGSSTVRTVRQALRAIRNRVAIAVCTATIYKEDDSTSSWTGAVTTTAGDPISEVNPAGP